MIADSIKIDRSQVRKAPGGGIVIDGRVGRSGVQAYRRPDGTVVKVLRPAREVLAADFRGSPLTVGHPAGGVKPENFQAVSIGIAQDRADVQTLEGEVYPVHGLQINDAAAIERILSGDLCELSCAYDVTQEASSGVHDGEAYDLIFRDLVPNHIAFGGEGFARAGREAKLLVADGQSEETVLMSDKYLPAGLISDSGDTSPQDRDALVAQVATLKAENKRLTKVADDAKTALDAAEGARTAADAAVAKLPELVADGVSKGIALRESARVVLGAEYVFDGKTPEQIAADVRSGKVAKLKELDPKLVVADSATDVWVDAYLEAAEKYSVSDSSEQVHDFNEGPTQAPVADGGAVDFQAHVRAISAKRFKGEV